MWGSQNGFAEKVRWGKNLNSCVGLWVGSFYCLSFVFRDLIYCLKSESNFILFILIKRRLHLMTSIACSGGLVRRSLTCPPLLLLLNHTALHRQPPAIEAMQSWV